MNQLKDKYPWLFLNKSCTVNILYDFTPNEEENERELAAGQDTMQTAQSLCDAISSTGNVANLIPITHETYKETIDGLKGDIVFNQVEEDELGELVLKELEKRHIPATGADSEGFNLSWDKVKIKEILETHKIPTPKYFTIKEDEELNSIPLPFPLFIKAADDHGSLSINENSFVENKEQLLKQLNWIREEIGGTALVEQYINGRELQASVIGNDNDVIVLPIKEITFGDNFQNQAKVVTFKAKWSEDPADSKNISFNNCPADLTTLQLQNIEQSIKQACHVLKVRDYARFDIRLQNDIPYIIDYNANPAIGPSDASALPAKVFGLNYPEFINAIIAVCLKRFNAL